VNAKTPEEIELSKLQARLTKRFHKACADYGMVADGDHILVGLSGGKDSLALVEMLGRRAQIYVPRFRVTALHVRVKESDYRTDLSYLEQFCAEAKVPLIVRDTEIGPNPDPSLKGRERTPSLQGRLEEDNPCFLCAWYRRKTLFNVAQELGCNKIAFGHHRDDVIETMLMNILFQGAFATMPPVLPLEKMPLSIIRPLCLIDEADLVRYATLRGYEKQPKLCPFEHVSSRAKVKDLLAQMRALNPEANDSLFASLTNIKTDYLPGKIS
jgi:tRNA(Ile)-lysidine synthase TilS/MesJ